MSVRSGSGWARRAAISARSRASKAQVGLGEPGLAGAVAVEAGRALAGEGLLVDQAVFAGERDRALVRFAGGEVVAADARQLGGDERGAVGVVLRGVAGPGAQAAESGACGGEVLVWFGEQGEGLVEFEQRDVERAAHRRLVLSRLAEARERLGVRVEEDVVHALEDMQAADRGAIAGGQPAGGLGLLGEEFAVDGRELAGRAAQVGDDLVQAVKASAAARPAIPAPRMITSNCCCAGVIAASCPIGCEPEAGRYRANGRAHARGGACDAVIDRAFGWRRRHGAADG